MKCYLIQVFLEPAILYVWTNSIKFNIIYTNMNYFLLKKIWYQIDINIIPNYEYLVKSIIILSLNTNCLSIYKPRYFYPTQLLAHNKTYVKDIWSLLKTHTQLGAFQISCVTIHKLWPNHKEWEDWPPVWPLKD